MLQSSFRVTLMAALVGIPALGLAEAPPVEVLEATAPAPYSDAELTLLATTLTYQRSDALEPPAEEIEHMKKLVVAAFAKEPAAQNGTWPADPTHGGVFMQLSPENALSLEAKDVTKTGVATIDELHRELRPTAISHWDSSAEGHSYYVTFDRPVNLRVAAERYKALSEVKTAGGDPPIAMSKAMWVEEWKDKGIALTFSVNVPVGAPHFWLFLFEEDGSLTKMREGTYPSRNSTVHQEEGLPADR